MEKVYCPNRAKGNCWNVGSLWRIAVAERFGAIGDIGRLSNVLRRHPRAGDR
jgi:hypothetical protein